MYNEILHKEQRRVDSDDTHICPSQIRGATDKQREDIMLEKLSAGENIASYCTKCKLVIDHAIVAMDGETIAKVKCKTCGSAHKYRSAADVKPARTPKKKEDAIRTAEVLWETCVAEAKGKERAYDMAGKIRGGGGGLPKNLGKRGGRKVFFNKCGGLFQGTEGPRAAAD